jgi:hypothetical protein
MTAVTSEIELMIVIRKLLAWLMIKEKFTVVPKIFAISIARISEATDSTTELS